MDYLYQGKFVKFLCPLLILADEDLWRLLVGSKCCVQRIDMFFGQLYVVLDIIQLKNKDVTQESFDLTSATHLSHCVAVLGRVAVVQTGARAGAGVLEVGSVHPRHPVLSNPR